jgi:hypothetical protein
MTGSKVSKIPPTRQPKTAAKKIFTCLGFDKALSITPFQLQKLGKLAGAVSEIGVGGKGLDQWPGDALEVVSNAFYDLIGEIEDQNPDSREAEKE